MKAILLAGGKGTRISKFIGDIPKSLININGMPLIKHTVSLLNENNIDTNIVLGYKQNLIKESLKEFKVKYFYNPFYETTNSIASLWFAKEQICDSDIIIANADVFFEQNILDIVLKEKNEQVMLIDKTIRNDYLFKCKGSKLIDHGKNLKNATAEYVGVAKIRKSFIRQFCERLNELIDQNHYNLWWENVLYSFITEISVNVKDINGSFWSEIDTIDDYKRILDFVSNKKHK